MKLLLVIFSVFATSLATYPLTPIVKDKLRNSLLTLNLIVLPDIDLDANISLLGLVNICVEVDVYSSKIVAVVDLAVEKAYSQTVSNGIIDFVLDLEAVVDIELHIDATVIVKTILGIQIGINACVLAYVDVVVDITVGGVHPDGVPSLCNIKKVNSHWKHSKSYITPVGRSLIGSVCDVAGPSILVKVFAALEVCVNAILLLVIV